MCIKHYVVRSVVTQHFLCHSPINQKNEKEAPLTDFWFVQKQKTAKRSLRVADQKGAASFRCRGMLPRARRAGKYYFKTQQNKGFSSSARFFSIRKTPTTPADNPAKFAVVVSYSVAKKAVDRNTLRRRVYAMIRKSGILSRTGATYVFYAKKEARGVSSKEILLDITEVFGNTHPS